MKCYHVLCWFVIYIGWSQMQIKAQGRFPVTMWPEGTTNPICVHVYRLPYLFFEAPLVLLWMLILSLLLLLLLLYL